MFALDNRSAIDGSYDIGGYYQTGNGTQHGFIATSTIGGAVGSP